MFLHHLAAGVGVIEAEFVVGVFTPAILNAIFCAAALFNIRFGVATPFVKSTLIVFGAAVYPDIVTFL
jgi:hypothetical protein